MLGWLRSAEPFVDSVAVVVKNDLPEM